jgi:hypothetical protein
MKDGVNIKMHINKVRIISVFLVVFSCGIAKAQVPPLVLLNISSGTPIGMEIGDIVYNKSVNGFVQNVKNVLSMGKEFYHPGIYLGFAYSGTLPLSSDSPMSQIYSTDLVSEVSPNAQQGPNQWYYDTSNLANFNYKSGRWIGGWIGAKTWNGTMTAEERNNIVATATSKDWSSVPFILRNESDAIELQDPYATNFNSITQIQAVRDDTYVETVYALANKPSYALNIQWGIADNIVPYNATGNFYILEIFTSAGVTAVASQIIVVFGGEAVLDAEIADLTAHGAGLIYDIKETLNSTQLNAYTQYKSSNLIPASSHVPALKILDGNGNQVSSVDRGNFSIFASGESSSVGSYKCSDDPTVADGSGIRLFEIWKGDPSGGGTLLKSDWVQYDSSNTYSESDLNAISGPVSDELPDGLLYARVFDKAGNWAMTSFTLTTPAPVVTLWSSVESNSVYSNFSGTNPPDTTPSTLYQNLYLTVRGPDIASVTITGSTYTFTGAVYGSVITLSPGTYAVDAKTNAGAETIAPFTVGAINILVDTANSDINTVTNADGTMSIISVDAQITVTAPSSPNTIQNVSIYAQDGTFIQTLSTSGGKINIPPTDVFRVVVTDSAGNKESVNVSDSPYTPLARQVSSNTTITLPDTVITMGIISCTGPEYGYYIGGPMGTFSLSSSPGGMLWNTVVVPYSMSNPAFPYFIGGGGVDAGYSSIFHEDYTSNSFNNIILEAAGSASVVNNVWTTVPTGLTWTGIDATVTWASPIVFRSKVINLAITNTFDNASGQVTIVSENLWGSSLTFGSSAKTVSAATAKRVSASSITAKAATSSVETSSSSVHTSPFSDTCDSSVVSSFVSSGTLKTALANLHGQGLLPVSPIVSLSTSAISLACTGTLKYHERYMAKAGISANGLRVVEFGSDGTMYDSTAISIDTTDAEVSFNIYSSTGFYAVFGSTTPVQPNIYPPVTVYNSLSYLNSADNTVTINKYAGIQPLPYSPGSSPTTTYYVINPSSQLLSQGLSTATVSQFTISTGTIILPEGTVSMAVGSMDADGNAESLVSGTINVDGTPPVSTISYSGSGWYSKGTLYIPFISSVTLTAIDPVSNGVASGVQNINYLVDFTTDTCIGQTGMWGAVLSTSTPAGTCNNPVYFGPFTPSQGHHTVYYSAMDNVYNIELVRALQVVVLSTATAVHTGKSYTTLNGNLYLQEAKNWIALVASNPSATVYYAIDPSPSLIAAGLSASTVGQFTVYSGTFSITSEGVHTLVYGSVDNAGNYEVLNATTIYVDGTAPVPYLQVGGVSVSSASAVAAVATSTFSVTAIDPNSNNAASGVDGEYVLIDVPPSSCSFRGNVSTSATQGTCANPFYTTPFNLSAGTHSLYVSAYDNVGNTSAISTVTVNVTTGTVISAAVENGTSLTLVGGGFGTTASQVFLGGVAATVVSWTDSGIVVTVPSSLGAGTYSAVVVTASGTKVTLPNALVVIGTITTTLQVNSGYTSSTGLIYGTNQTSFTLNTSGISAAQTYYAVDLSTAVLAGGLGANSTSYFTAYSQPFSVSGEGAHVVAFGSLDTSGAYEVLKSTSVYIDNTAPLVYFKMNGVAVSTSNAVNGSLAGMGLVQLSQIPAIANSTFTLNVYDPVSNGVASGVGRTMYLVDVSPADCASMGNSGTAGTCANPYYSGAFNLSAGTHTVYALAMDNAGNTSNLVALPVNVTTGTVISAAELKDSNLLIAGGGFGTQSGTVTIGGETATAVRWTDGLIIAGVPSNLSAGNYTATVTTSGGTTVTLSGALQVGSLATTLKLNKGYTSSTGRMYADASSYLSLTANTQSAATYYEVDPSTAMLALGLSAETTGAFTLYSGTFSVTSEGIHLVAYGSVDTSGNYEALKSTAVFVDNTAPLEYFKMNGVAVSTSNAATSVLKGTNIVALPAVQSLANSTFTFTAYDPVSNNVASGVNREFLLVDVSPFSCKSMGNSGTPGTCANPYYNGAFNLAIGTHTVYALTTDNVGNTGALLELPVTVTTGTVITATEEKDSNLLIAGGGFGTTAGTVSIGGENATVVRWTDGLIVAVIPSDLATGNYSAAVTTSGGTTVTLSGALQVGDITTSLQLSNSYTSPTGKLYTSKAMSPYYSLTTNNTASATYYKVDVSTALIALGLSGQTTGMFRLYAGTFTVTSEGMHLIAFGSIDASGNYEALKSTVVHVDNTAPVVAALIDGVAPDTTTVTNMKTSSVVTLSATDPVSKGVSSGVNGIMYLVDEPLSACNSIKPTGTGTPGTCTNPYYTGGFSLGAGAHTIIAVAQDNVNNMGSPLTINVNVTSPATITPTEGPIGQSFTLTGTNLGNYLGSGKSLVLIGGATAQLSLWTGTTVQGTIPGSLAPATYPVQVEWVYASSSAAATFGYFTVATPTVTGMTPMTGPIGQTFTITGGDFGNYASGYTTILFDGTTCQLSLWNGTTVQGTIPGNLSAGQHAVWIQRSTSDGGLVASATGYFIIVTPAISAISPSAGPIGQAFTLTGTGFGDYANTAYTNVLIGGTTCPLTLWNSTTVQGTIPGNLAAGNYTATVERRTSDGGLVDSAGVPFSVTALSATSIAPTSGPIGQSFTITGNFGNYSSGYTTVLMDGTTTAISLWNATTIQATVPGGMAAGQHSLVVSRTTSGGGLAQSSTMYFTVTVPTVTGLTPTNGPIGQSFTITGTNFGNYFSGYTTVLMDATTTSLSLWNGTTLQATVPGSMTAGQHAVTVNIATPDGGLIKTSSMTFTVTAPAITGLSPTNGPIGQSFTITGSNFGSYASGYSQVLMDGTTVAVSLWNSTTIQAKVPGNMSVGQHSVAVGIATPDGGVVETSSMTFTVTAPALTALSPSSGPIGQTFTITGSNFGGYASGYSLVLMDATTCQLSLWNATTIQATVPGRMSAGQHSITVGILTSDGGITQTSALAFTVSTPAVYGITPSSGPIGQTFTITGTGFGSYVSSYDNVLIGGTTCPLSLWAGTTIQGTIPGSLVTGTYPALVDIRTSDGGLMDSATMYFTVAGPAISTMTPISGPIGQSYTIVGTNFGSYSSGSTVVLIGGVTTQVSLWNGTTIQGTIPGSLASGIQPVVVQRTANGMLSRSATSYFTVTVPQITGVSPSTGPIGQSFMITGGDFGSYASAYETVLLGGTTCPLSLWASTTVQASVPGGMATGTYPLIVQRTTSDGGLVATPTAYFTVDAPQITAITPSTAPVGQTFTLSGSGFGSYASGNTVVLIGGTTATLSLWNDTQVQGTMPYLSTGTYTVTLERIVSGYTVSVSTQITVITPQITALTLNTASSGTTFVLSGTGFGSYNGTLLNGITETAVLVDGATACSLSSWSDTRISGIIPTADVSGTHTLQVARALSAGAQYSNTASYTSGGNIVVNNAMASAAKGAAAKVQAAWTSGTPDPNAGLPLPAQYGGHVEAGNRAAVNIPANALTADTYIAVSTPTLTADDSAAMLKAEEGALIAPAGPTVYFGPEGIVFASPATITLPFDATLLPYGKTSNDVAVYNWDESSHSWQPLPSTLSGGNFTASTEHFSLYRAMVKGVNLAASSAFAFHQFYVYPNPAKNGYKPILHLECGIGDGVDVRIYDVAGTLRHSAHIDGGPTVLAPQYAYEYTWDMGGAGSGVYTAVVVAHKGGQTVEATKKFAIIK